MLKVLSSFIHSHEKGFRVLNASPVAAGVGKADLCAFRDEEKSEGEKRRKRDKMRETVKKRRDKQ
jgi:hypothetical protein